MPKLGLILKLGLELMLRAEAEPWADTDADAEAGASCQIFSEVVKYFQRLSEVVTR